MDERAVVLVTGASSGMGKEIGELLAQRGYRVFGTSRRDVDGSTREGVRMLRLDVTQGESVEQLIDTIDREAGRLDIVINNAGYALTGAVEETSLEEARRQFETNFFGVVRIIKAALPLLRRQGGGKIINISSFLGLAAAPFMGLYSATKFALEGYGEALRHELKPLNISVSSVEPGWTRTGLGQHAARIEQPIEDYGPWRSRATEAIRDSLATGTRPRTVADTVLKIVQSRRPKLRYPVGKDARLGLFMRWLLPGRAFEKLVCRLFKLD